MSASRCEILGVPVERDAAQVIATLALNGSSSSCFGSNVVLLLLLLRSPTVLFLLPDKTSFNATQGMECTCRASRLVRGVSWLSPIIRAVAQRGRQGQGQGGPSRSQTAVRGTRQMAGWSTVTNWSLEERWNHGSSRLVTRFTEDAQFGSCFGRSGSRGFFDRRCSDLKPATE